MRGHETSERGVRFVERGGGRAEGQAVGFDVGVLDRQSQQIVVDVLELGEGRG